MSSKQEEAQTKEQNAKFKINCNKCHVFKQIGLNCIFISCTMVWLKSLSISPLLVIPLSLCVALSFISSSLRLYPLVLGGRQRGQTNSAGAPTGTDPASPITQKTPDQKMILITDA